MIDVSDDQYLMILFSLYHITSKYLITSMGVVVVLWSEVMARVLFNCVAKNAHL